MERIATILVFAMVYKLVRGKAIHNAINLRLNPIFKGENTAATPAIGVFAKIPHDLQPPDYGLDVFPKSYIPNIEKVGVSCSNQIAKVLFPENPNDSRHTRDNYEQFLKIPIISQPFPDYKIIVATAPWNMRITGSEAKPVVIYFVFPEDDEPNSINIPEIYFVKKEGEPKDINRKDKIDPLIIVDHNRTVTGLKSKAVAKFIKFKNKLNQ